MLKITNSHEKFDSSTIKSAGFFLFAFTLLNVLAAKNHIVLWADASLYLLGLINSDQFVSIEPTSRSVQLLQQLPVILAMRLGMESIESLMLISGLANLMLPLLLTASCYWILPKEHKGFIIFPYVHYLMGAMSSWFPTVTDAPPAVAYFWMLFYLILFRTTTWSTVLLGFLALPALYLHEAMSFLAFLLVFALLWRFKNTTNIYLKVAFLLLSSWFLFIAWNQFLAILKPRSVNNREGFISVLLEWKWIYWDGINIAVVLSIIATLLILFVLVINLSGIERKLQPAIRIVRQIIPLVLVSAVFGVWLLLLHDPRSYGLFAQFAARSQSAFVTIPLASIVLVSVYVKSSQIAWRDRLNIHLVTILAIGIAGGHAIGLMRWHRYVEDIKWLLGNNKGFVPYEFAIEQLPDGRDLEFRTLSGWWNPTMSFLLSPDGHVAATVGTSSVNAWQPFDPCDSDQLPRGRFDVSSYLQTIEVQGCNVFEQFGERVPIVSKIEGLAHLEKWGRWSKGEQVDFYFNKPIPEHVVLAVSLQAFGPNIGAPVILKAGTTQALIGPYKRFEPVKVELRLTEPTYKLSFIVPNPVSPKSLGIGSDKRTIGLGFRSLNIYENNDHLWVSLDFSKLKIYQ